MIQRHWKAVARADEAENYIRHLQTKTFPHLSGISGFIKAMILKRQLDNGVEFLIITTWKSIEAIKQFAGNPVDTANVPAEAQEMMIRFDQKAIHYEVVESFSKPMTNENELILAGCLRATVYSNFFPEWEFHTIFGVTREEVKTIYQQWPNVDFSDENVILAVHNMVNNLTGYPIAAEELERWADYISISRKELAARFPEFRGIM
jgi:heme-degrading monooxygenase HmoA